MTVVYLELHSGFGNQIFQYAFALSLQKQFSVFILPSKGNDHSTTNYQTLFKSAYHATEEMVPSDITLVNKKSKAFEWWDTSELKQFKAVRICGYHQNYKFFGDSIAKKISKELYQHFYALYGHPSWNQQTTGFIHVRRTNYLLPHIKMYNLTMEYYREAITRVESLKSSVKNWLVITDDIAWCKFQDWPENVTIFEETDEAKCFWAFTQCQGAAIIANSTFSYWGAIVSGSYPVVYPKAWHLQCAEPDLFPKTWYPVGSKEKSLKIQ